MSVFLTVLIAIPGCLACNAHTAPKNRAKVVEDYVISAKFDEKTDDIPQLSEKIGKIREGQKEAKEASIYLPPSHSPKRQQGDDFDDRSAIDRDLLVHHLHLPHSPPAPPPPPPPPPPPAPLAHAPPLFAVGFIGFLILLNSLQTTLLLMLKSKNSLLGTVTGALGRRRRSLAENQKEQETVPYQIEEPTKIWQ